MKTEIEVFYIFKYDFKKIKYYLNIIVFLDAKLLLINVNYIENFLLEVYRYKKFDKMFHTYIDVVD